MRNGGVFLSCCQQRLSAPTKLPESLCEKNGESPERRSCFSTFDLICRVLSPAGERKTMFASRWSIHIPTCVFIGSFYLRSSAPRLRQKLLRVNKEKRRLRFPSLAPLRRRFSRAQT